MTRWRNQLVDAVLAGFAPFDGPGLAPRVGEVDYAGTFERMRRATNPRAALGLWVALWIAVFAPIWLEGTLRTMRALPVARRAELLERLLAHRWFFVRELTTLLKLAASLALFASDSVRARSGYDGHGAIVHESGERLRLPIAHPTAAEEAEEEVA
jgi:hypothetical protein